MWKTEQIFVVFLEYLNFNKFCSLVTWNMTIIFQKWIIDVVVKTNHIDCWKILLFPNNFQLEFLILDHCAGAQTTIYCCVDKDAVKHNGHYFVDCQKKDIFPWLIDDRKQKLCWDVSKKLVKFD